jgi:hypothetical protein
LTFAGVLGLSPSADGLPREVALVGRGGPEDLFREPLAGLLNALKGECCSAAIASASSVLCPQMECPSCPERCAATSEPCLPCPLKTIVRAGAEKLGEKLGKVIAGSVTLSSGEVSGESDGF